MFYRWLSRTVEILIFLCATVIVTIVTAEVILRYGFNHSLIFTEELSRYLMVWIVFLGSALAIRDGSHININFMVKRFDWRVRKWVHAAAYLLTLVFLLIVTVEGLRILPQQLYQMCITFDLSVFYFYLAIPVGCILMILFLFPVAKKVLSQTEDPEGEGGQPAC